MKLLKFIICFSIFHTVQILYAQDVKESEFLIYSELYNSKSIHNLERPSYLCREIKSNQAVLPNCYKQNIHKV